VNLAFKVVFEGIYEEENEYFDLEHTFSLFQKKSPSHVMAFEVSGKGNTANGFEMEEYSTRIRYRHKFYRDWLFYEVQPEIFFPREDDFDAKARFVLKFEVIFDDIA